MTLLGLWTLIRSFPDKVVAGLVLAAIFLASAALLNASCVALTPTELLAGSLPAEAVEPRAGDWR